MDYIGLLLSMIVWSLLLAFAFFTGKNISTPQEEWERIKDWHYFERFFHYSGIKFIFRKFIPAKNSNRFPTGFIWLIGLYFASYAFTNQRYENQLDKVEFRYTIFTTQVAAGAIFSNRRLMGILQENIPVKPAIDKPKRIYKSFFYNPNNSKQFYQTQKNKDGKHYNSAQAFRQEIIFQWSRKLKGADFRQAQLKGVDFRHAQLEGAIFNGAQLEGADFNGAQLKGADFEHAQLEGAIFDGAQLEGADFEYAQLEGAYFGGTQLKRANFEFAKLEDADFAYAKLEDADFAYAKLEGAYFGGTQLKRANFKHAQLKGANFEFAQLGGAYFGEIQLEGVNFWIAQLKGADFEYAQLKGVKSLTAQQLIQAKSIFRIGNCPQDILEGIKKYGCIEMLETRPEKWSEQFIEYRKKLISQW